MKRAIFALVVLILISGCATAPEKKPDTENTVTFYPSLPQRPRLQYLMSISTEDDLGKKQSSLDQFLIGKESSNKKIEKPYDIGSTKGKIFILDIDADKLIYIDLAKKKFDYLKDNKMGTLHKPSGIWVTPDEIKYVADFDRKQVVSYDSEGKYLMSYGDKDLFEKPVDVAIYENRIYVCDMGKMQVHVLDRTTGAVVKTIGKPGREDGNFFKPTHLVVDNKGFLFVNDAFNFRVQKFDTEGTFIKSYGKLGDNTGCFARPKGIEVDKEGHIYVVDAAFENVQIFDEETGRLLLFFGGPGSAPGSMYLPAGIHIDYENMEYFSNYVDKDFRLKYLLYVGNTFGGQKLNVYGFGDWIGPAPAEDNDKKADSSEPDK